MTVMEKTTCFGLCWPSAGCLGNLREEDREQASARPQRHKPPHLPPFHKIELTSSLYFMCFVSLPICIMFHSVLPDPCFDSVCQIMRM